MTEFKFIKTDYLDMVAGGDPELEKELADIFREQADEIYTEMRIHLADKNYAALGQLAHKAKSSVAIMGMDDLAEMLRVLEIKARDGTDAEEYESYISRFGSDTRSAVIELDYLINNR